MSDLFIKPGILIPAHELEIWASRSGGAGGQHVNKTSSKVSVSWHVTGSTAISSNEKERILKNLASRITTEGYLIVSNGDTRSQHENKKRALDQLTTLLEKALHIPKKRTATKISKGIQEKRLHTKSARGEVKKLRRKPSEE